jgi:hypothetical protein
MPSRYQPAGGCQRGQGIPNTGVGDWTAFYGSSTVLDPKPPEYGEPTVPPERGNSLLERELVGGNLLWRMGPMGF